MEQNQEGGLYEKNTLWIIAGIIVVIMIVGLVYGATQRSLKNADQDAAKTSTSKSGSSLFNSLLGDASSTAPIPAPEDRTDLPVELRGLEIVNLDVLPQKLQAKLSYSLSGDCAVLMTPSVEQSGKTFSIALSSYSLKDAPCTKNLVPGEQVIEIPLEGYAPGKYTVKLGKFSKAFTLKSDNLITNTPQK